MGGSLGMALARSGKWRVVGVGRRPARLRAALRRRCLHEYTTDFARGVAGASVVVIGAPVDEIVPLAARLRPHLAPGTLVMDVGSVKEPIVRALRARFARPEGPYFIGAHPMAGSEKTGAEHARADLYRGATCVLAPDGGAPRAAVKKAAAFWRSVGADVVVMRAAEHDRWVALVSHLPHLMADALVLAAGSRAGAAKRVRQLAAGSFRDATRVAAADPAQWSAIFAMNRPALKRSVAAFRRELDRLAGSRAPLARLRAAGKLHGIFMDHSGRTS